MYLVIQYVIGHSCTVQQQNGLNTCWIVEYKVGVLALISHHKLEYPAYLPLKAWKKYEPFLQDTPDTRGGVSGIEGSN